MLPQSFWLENNMYVSWLMQHKEEWADADFVGTIASTAAEKQPKVFDIQLFADAAHAQGSDFVALYHVRDPPLIPMAEGFHPGFTRAWLETWRAMGYTDAKKLLDPSIPCFYCNYWAAHPSLMERYCQFMAYLDFKLSVDPRLKSILWTDAQYAKDGIPQEKRKELFGVPYYPKILFVAERLICVFANMYAKHVTLLPIS